MNFTRYHIESTLDNLDSKKLKIGHKIQHVASMAVVILLLSGVVLGAALGFGMFRGILDSAPDIHSIHVMPTAYATRTYDRDGNLTATLVTEGSNREKVSFEEIPTDMINAFVAIEDERFWDHNGIDMKSILRAIHGVFTDDDSAGGGSTLTQQLIKNNVFGGGLHEGKFEKYIRKFQEQYLALELENQPGVDKQTVKKNIITAYLNTINLGSNTLGVKVASRRYFDKEVSDLTLSECAVIASITQNPSALNPITNPEANNERRKRVLSNMKEQGYITDAQYKEALADNVYDRIKDVDVHTKEVDKPYSYFTDELTAQVIQELQDRLGYTKEEARNLLYAGGLSIYTTQDPKIQAIVDEEVNDPANYDSVKYSVDWRLTVRHKDGSIVNYSEKDLLRYMREILGMNFNGLFLQQDSAKEYIKKYKAQLLSDTDEIVGETYNTRLEPQVSVVLMDPHTGEVLAINGGRGEKTQSLTLNRATNTLRQPGSTFKVLSAFAPAIDKYGATLATPYYDAEYTIGDKTFKNWYSGGYLGYQTIRDGVQYSLNIVAVRCLMETVQPANGLAYARSLGITSLLDTDANPALALGGLTYGVSNLELTQAFSCIANGGKLNKAKFFTKILDQDGKVLIDTTEDTPKQVMQPETAYLLTSAMEGSMLPNKAFANGLTVRSTSTRAHFDGMSLAGKSGTTTNNVDVWFEGFSPYYITGIWAGCDENQSLNDKKTGEYNGGTGFHKDIWKKIMSRVHEGLSDPGFTKPADIVEAEVCRKSGKLPIRGCSNDYRGSAVITEYFKKGTVPTEDCDVHYKWGGIKLPEDEEDKQTDDRDYSYRSSPEVSDHNSNESATIDDAGPVTETEHETEEISDDGPGTVQEEHDADDAEHGEEG
jgi:penicillin-binding protein 1A